MRKVILSNVTDVACTDRLNDCLKQQKTNGKPIYYLLPTNKWLQAARKRRAGIAFKTFDDLADLILTKSNVQYFPVSESVRTILFLELMYSLDDKLANSLELRHKAKAYASTYGQLKRLGLGIDDLPKPYKQLESIFREYEEEWIKKRKLLDPENRFHVAMSYKDPEIELGGIIIDGYFDFSTLQYMLIEYFANKKCDITIYLPNIPDSRLIIDTIQQLKKLNFEIETEVAHPQVDLQMITVKSATTMKEEIYGVLNEISHEKFNEVGIVLADENKYLDTLTSCAAEMNVPIQLPEVVPLKNTLVFQLIYYSILKHSGRFISRWDKLEIVDTLLRLQFLASTKYMAGKKTFIETQTLNDEQKDMLDQCINFRKKAPSKAPLNVYLEQLKTLLESLPLTKVWRQLLMTETNTKKLKQVRLEWKAFEQLLATISNSIEHLRSQNLSEVEIHYYNFVEWLFENITNKSIYVDRMRQDGIAIYSFRDVALFKGKQLYVLGMNEGVFPKNYQLAGYFQESDLKSLPIPFAIPNKKQYRMKDDTMFQQLFLLSPNITFSYVVGVDPNHPLLPSVYLEQWKKEIKHRHYSSISRLSSNSAFSSQDLEEKISYHIGIGRTVENVPLPLKQMKEVLLKLETGQETVSPHWKEQLSREKLSVTMLESYAACPFKYALEHLLKVKEPILKKTNLDFRDTGSMLHTIIEKFYKQLQLVGKPFSAFTNEMKENAEKVLFTIFEDEWSRIEEKHLDFSKLQLEIEKEQWMKKLRKWWLAELKHFWDNKQLQTMHLFRLEEAIELDLLIDDQTTITLTGKIDRIDIDEDGFVIYDYKSGSASLNFQKEVRSGLKLQLPLYLVAMENRLANGHYQLDLIQEETPTAHGAAYITLKHPAKRAGNSVWREEHFGRSSKFFVNSSATKEETLASEILLAKYGLLQRLKELWENTSLDFSVKPLQCFSNCPYKSVCRVTPELIEAGEEDWK